MSDRTDAAAELEELNRQRLLKFFTPAGDDECWPWQGFVKSNGYGQFNLRLGVGNYTTRPAHRAVYEAVVGSVPESLELDHLCRNRACVNPAHLEPVTRAENIARSVPFMKRGDENHNRAKTHCPQGHEYSPENTYITPDGTGRRQCITCRRKRVREWMRRQSA